MNPRLFLFLIALATLTLGAPATPPSIDPVPRLQSYPWMSLERWFEMHAEDTGLAEKGEASLLFIGDSITQGWNGEGADLWERYFAPLGAVNFGIGGDMTQNLVWRLRNGAVLNLNPKAIVLLIGTNNFGFFPGEPPIHVASGVTLVVDELHRSFPEADILLMAVFPRGAAADDPNRARIAELNRIISGLDDRPYVTFLDINRRFLAEDGSLPAELMPDFLHLSPKGYQIWAEAVLPWIQARVGE